MALKRVRDRRDDAVSRVGWQSMETLLAEYYRGQGYAVEHVGTAGTGARYDGGIDLKLRRGDAYTVVQVKHWNAYKVPHNDVHQLLGVMVNEGATGAILITSGEFTRAAVDAATRQGHVQLVDGSQVRAMLGAAFDALPSPAGASRELDAFVAAVDPRARATRRLSPPRSRSVYSSQFVWLACAFVGVAVFAVIVHTLLEQTAWSARDPQLDMPDAQTQGWTQTRAFDARDARGRVSAPNEVDSPSPTGPVIYKCVDAGRAVSYQNMPCEGDAHAVAVRPFTPQREPTRAERALNEARWATSGAPRGPGIAASIPIPPSPSACEVARAERASWERNAGLNRTYDQMAYWNAHVARACK